MNKELKDTTITVCATQDTVESDGWKVENETDADNPTEKGGEQE